MNPQVFRPKRGARAGNWIAAPVIAGTCMLLADYLVNDYFLSPWVGRLLLFIGGSGALLTLIEATERFVVTHEGIQHRRGLLARRLPWSAIFRVTAAVTIQRARIMQLYSGVAWWVRPRMIIRGDIDDFDGLKHLIVRRAGLQEVHLSAWSVGERFERRERHKDGPDADMEPAGQ